MISTLFHIFLVGFLFFISAFVAIKRDKYGYYRDLELVALKWAGINFLGLTLTILYTVFFVI